MSHYETPEQRRQRELRQQLSAYEQRIANSEKENRILQQNINNLKQQQDIKNQQLRNQMQRALEDQQRNMTNRVNQTIRALDEQVKQRERFLNDKMRVMHQQHQEQLNAMENQMEQQRSDLHNEIQNTRREMQQSIEQMRNETDSKLEQQRIETQRQLETVSSRLADEINRVDGKVESLAAQIEARENGHRELAEYWSQESARILNDIKENFHRQLVDPGKLAEIDRKVRDSESDIKNGIYQAGVTSGRDAFYLALDLKEQASLAELEWNLRYNSIKNREVSLLTAIDQAEHRAYELELNGTKYNYTNGIDYWTYGQFSIFKENCAAVRARTENIDNMTLPELESLDREFRSLEEQLALIENASHSNVAMSISRYRTAMEVAAMLNERYEMSESDGDFFAREDRDEYHAVFINPQTQDRAVLTITPVPDRAGFVMNHIDLLVDPADSNIVTSQEIARALGAHLSETVLDDCKFPCSGRFGAETSKEVERVGDISAVENGDENARASVPGKSAPQAERPNDPYHGVRRTSTN